MSAWKRLSGARLALVLTTVAVGSLALASSAMADGSATSGSFVIGDQNASAGDQVTFWGAQWWQDNSLSGGPAPASFKGFADDGSATCGAQWTTRPGNSSDPPPTLPLTRDGYLPVVVSTHITKSGPVISGDVAEVVLVQVDPGYQPDPGHPGTGTVIGIVCGPLALT